jgi:hypothetical protein
MSNWHTRKEIIKRQVTLVFINSYRNNIDSQLFLFWKFININYDHFSVLSFIYLKFMQCCCLLFDLWNPKLANFHAIDCLLTQFVWSHISCSADFHMAEYAILFYTRNSDFWLDNWRSACSERLFLMPKSRYFIKAEVVNSIPYIKELREYLQYRNTKIQPKNSAWKILCNWTIKCKIAINYKLAILEQCKLTIPIYNILEQCKQCITIIKAIPFAKII